MSSSPRAKADHVISELFDFIRSQYPDLGEIPLHTPVLGDAEKNALAQCIDSTYVSSVGPAIADFEQAIASASDAQYAVAVVNGTAALQLALRVVGVEANTEVITQSLTFIGTANAIAHAGAEPVFIDVNRDTLGLCPMKLREWLANNALIVKRDNSNNSAVKTNRCINRHTQREIAACVCMHTFGHPANIHELRTVCEEFFIPLVEDAAEAMGSVYQGRAVGAQTACGILSFNGNKIITTGGGGALLTNNRALADQARHLATTAKISHPWEYQHDAVGFNYRLPNLNASLGCAQLQRLPHFLTAKRKLADAYQHYFANTPFQWISEPRDCQSNYWLNAIICNNQTQRDALLTAGQTHGIQLRPVWQPLSESVVYRHCQRGDLQNTLELATTIINLPSGVAGLIYADA